MIEASNVLLGALVFLVLFGVAHMIYVCSSESRYRKWKRGDTVYNALYNRVMYKKVSYKK